MSSSSPVSCLCLVGFVYSYCHPSEQLYSCAWMRNGRQKKSHNFQSLPLSSILYDDFLKISKSQGKKCKLGPMYYNFPRTFPHRETGFELRLFWFWIKRLNAFSMSLAYKYVNLKDHEDIKEQISTKSFLKKNTGSTWNPQPRGIVWIRCFPNPIRYL